MSISVALDATRRMVLATAAGNLTLAELREFLQTARTGEHRLWPLLFDASAASTEITTAQIGGLAAGVGAMVKRDGPRGPVAMVASNAALFGVMRMYQILCETEGFDAICVVKTREDAELWLAGRA